jgi:hypothetical protein
MHIRHLEAGTDGMRSSGVYIVLDDRPVVGPFRSVSEAQGCLCPVPHEQLRCGQLSPVTITSPRRDALTFLLRR